MKKKLSLAVFASLMLVSLASCSDGTSTSTESSSAESSASEAASSSSSSSEVSSSEETEAEPEPEPEVITYSNYQRNGEITLSSDLLSICYGSDFTLAFNGGSDGSVSDDLSLDILPSSVVDDVDEEGNALYGFYDNISSLNAVYSIPSTWFPVLTLLGMDMSGVDYPHFMDSARLALDDYNAKSTSLPDETLSLDYIDGTVSYSHYNNGEIDISSSEETAADDESSSETSQILRGFAESYVGEIDMPTFDYSEEVSGILEALDSFNFSALDEIDFSNLDLSEYEIDWSDLLLQIDEYVDSGEIDMDSLTSILGTLGGALWVLGEGLDIDISTNSLDYSTDVSFTLNDLGIERASYMLGYLVGDTVPLNITEAAFGFNIYNTAEESNLISNIWLDAGIGFEVSGLSFELIVDLDVDLCEIEQFSSQLSGLDLYLELSETPIIDLSISLDDEITEISDSYFTERSADLAENRIINDEAEAYWSQIKGWVSSDNYYADPSTIDVTAAGGEYISGVAAKYADLSDAAKIILGDEIDADTIVSGYNTGLGYIQSAVSNYSTYLSLSGGETLSATYLQYLLMAGINYSTYTMDYVNSYKNWDEAMKEQEGGADVLTGINSALDSIIASVENAATAAETYAADKTDDTLAAFIEAGSAIASSDDLSTISTFLYGDYETRYNAIIDTYEDSIATASKAYLKTVKDNYLKSSSTYANMVTGICNDTFAGVRSIYGASNTVAYMATASNGTSASTTYTKRVQNKCSSQASTDYNKIAAAFKSATTLSEFNTALSDASLEEDLANIDTLELYILGTNTYTVASSALISYARSNLSD